MESVVEEFCDCKDYKLVSKRLKGAKSSQNEKLHDFIKYLKENRKKRKSTALSFEVILALLLKVYNWKLSDKYSRRKAEIQNGTTATEETKAFKWAAIWPI